MNNNSKDIVATAIAHGGFGTLIKALKASDLVETLKGVGPFTVFAPTDIAFAKLSAEMMASLLDPENVDRLKEVLLYHVLSGSKLFKKDLVDKEVMKMANGDTAMVNLKQSTQVVFPRGSSTVLIPDMETINGVIHGIDTVMMPK
jgi:uncharacterized surface protein with fasciclin (FAS1) repeats